jgi:UDP-N-acetylmuramate--alanine ligase
VIDDYAHHPTEVKATLSAVAKYPHNKIWCIFQPHTYTRTKTLLNEFSQSFDNVDYIVVMDIYAAREKDPGDIHSRTYENVEKQKEEMLYI